VLSSFVAGLGLLCAVVALLRVRRLSRSLEAVTQSYWELRYEYTRLRARVSEIDPEEPPAEPGAVPPPTPSVSFVPLSAIRKKDR
jgi:hypothetical protein